MKSQLNRPTELFLKVIRRKIYPCFFKNYELPELRYLNDKDDCQKRIYDALNSDKPFMVARFGSVEMAAVANYVGVLNNVRSILRYIKGEIPEWWWQMTSLNQLQSNAGFFPITEGSIIKFGELYLKDAQQIDILGSWLRQEQVIQDSLKNAHKVWLGNLEPPYLNTFSENNWMRALKDKRVLVIHPFAETIEHQYKNNRTKLYANPDFMPEFELHTIKAVQSIGGNNQYASWFESLDCMKSEMDKIEYDVCILGCGAYGLPLAAHAKRTGHKSIHLGGSTQLLFGIRGNRWDHQEQFKSLFNEYWVRPAVNERPKNAASVENGCYW